MPDKSVDLVLTDPPYGISINRKTNKFGSSAHLSRKATTKTWDECIPGKEYFDEIFRVSKNQIVFGANYFWGVFYATQCYIIWDKRGNLPQVPFCDTEFAWTSFKDRMSKKYTVINHGFIKDSKDEKTGHPTQKPTELFRMILEDFSKQGEIILDPFMGSGTTGIASVEKGCVFHGSEIEQEYFFISEKRIEHASRQGQLFGPANKGLQPDQNRAEQVQLL